MNQSVLNTILFYLEDDDHEEVNFNGETLTFTMQMIKFELLNEFSKNLEVIHIVLEEHIDLLQQKFMVI